MNIKIAYAIFLLFILTIIPLFFNFHKIENNNDSNSFELSYCKGIESFNKQNIFLKKFKPIPKSLHFGKENGNYWIKIKLNNYKINEQLIAHIPTHNIETLNIYKLTDNHLKLISKTGNNYLKFQNHFHNNFPNFELINSKNDIYYLNVHFKRDANFPLSFYNKESFLEHILLKKIYNGIYYGISLLIIVLNLISYFTLKYKINLHYVLFLLALNLKFLLHDGTLIAFFSGSNVYNYLELFINLFCQITFLIFSINFLNLKKYHPKITKLLYIFPLVTSSFYFIYLLIDNFIFFSIADIFGILLFPTLWIISIYSIKKIPYAKFFAIGYFLIIPFALFFIIGYHFGIWKIDGDMFMIKIASGLEIIVFSIALIYMFKNDLLQKQNEELLKYEGVDFVEHNLVPQNFNIFDLLKENKYSDTSLTLRELDVLKLLLENHTNKVISDKLYISPNTLKSHIRNIYSKLSVKNRIELKNKINL